MLGRSGVVGLIAAAALAQTAEAQVSVGECSGRALRGAECGSLGVPLDHAVPADRGGQVLTLNFARYRATGTRRGTVVLLAGGPGQAAIPFARQFARGPLRALRRTHDLVFVDQRGSGRSSPLRCSTAPRGVFRVDGDAPGAAARAVRRCADELGETRRFYSTHETALDLEDLRAQLGVPQIIPLGISYGGQVASEYARRFPERTQALVLDSTSPVEGLDALGTLPQLALPRVLREVCFPPGCARLLGDPRRLLERAVARLSRGPLRGRVVLPSGTRRRARISMGDLYALVSASDTDPALRTALPAALEAAGRGDAAPLLRLALRAEGSPTASDVNEVRFLATTCAEGRLPWEPTSDPATRPGLLEAALAAQAAAFAPFPADVVAVRQPATLCLGWPPQERGARPPLGRGPDVPVLVLAGREDLRTPLEDQRRSASQFPDATVFSLANVGHSVLSNDPTSCAGRTVARFLAGAELRPCRTLEQLVPLALPAPPRLGAVPGADGRAPARVERTAVAVDLTLRDAARQLAALAVGGGASGGRGRRTAIGGLRGGRLVVRGDDARLARYEVVPGVRVSGSLTGGTLVVAGSGARGVLRLRRSGTFSGVLGGTRIVYRPKRLT